MVRSIPYRRLKHSSAATPVALDVKSTVLVPLHVSLVQLGMPYAPDPAETVTQGIECTKTTAQEGNSRFPPLRQQHHRLFARETGRCAIDPISAVLDQLGCKIQRFCW